MTPASEALLGEGEGALGHLIELVENDEVGVDARDLLLAVGAAEEEPAFAEALQPFRVGPLARGRLGLETSAQVGAVLDRAVEA